MDADDPAYGVKLARRITGVSEERVSTPLLGDPAGLEADVDNAIAACGGDPRAAVRALIVLVDHLEEELRRRLDNVSRGYVRGRGGPQR
ncbi:hypothetical protein SAMN05519103_03998 [Rhizobiales bacterium GAS113]|nr:hypothetical protein SAMN05519103_03998 [Rhizobiales bacterium GAS113]